MRARSRLPSAAMNSAPKVALIASIAAPPASVRDRAIASVSISAAPWATRIDATVLLPLPIPPVRPMRSGEARAACSAPAEPAEHARLASEHDGDSCAGKERAERNVMPFAQRRAHLHDDADDGADQRRSEDDGQDHLQPEPGAERSEQLEVTEAH